MRCTPPSPIRSADRRRSRAVGRSKRSAFVFAGSRYEWHLPTIAAIAAVALWSAGARAGAGVDRCSAEAPAIMELTAALASGPGPPAKQAALLRRRGRLWYERGHDQEALADYDAALELAPDLAEAHLDRGRLHADQANYPAALADLDRAIQLQPDHVQAYLERGHARYEIADHTAAIADFSTALVLDPEAAGAYLGRADALRDSDRPEQALTDYAAAIRLAPDNAEAWFQRAIAQHRLDRFDAERADWATAVRLDSDLFWLYGTIYRHRLLYEGLRSDQRTALQHAPDGAKALFNRGEARRYHGRYCAAIADFTRAIDLRPGYHEISDVVSPATRSARTTTPSSTCPWSFSAIPTRSRRIFIGAWPIGPTASSSRPAPTSPARTGCRHSIR